MALPCQHWSPIGAAADEKGYVYRDSQEADGPCKKELLKNGRQIKALCDGKNPIHPVDFDPTVAGVGSVGVVLKLGAGRVPYCAEFEPTSATVRTDDELRFRAENAAPPASCPFP